MGGERYPYRISLTGAHDSDVDLLLLRLPSVASMGCSLGSLGSAFRDPTAH